MPSRLGAFFGIEKAEGRLLRVRFRRRFLFFLIVFVLVVGSGGFLYFSTKAGFCASCHIMQPYVASWRESSHGKKGIQCVKCHFPPGFRNAVEGKVTAVSQLVAYITGTYGTSFVAEIEDASCMRSGCHDKRLLEGKVDFKGVHFDHKPHLTELRRGKRLRCQTCHSQIVQGLHLTVTESVCFICHFKDLKHGRIEQPVAGCTGCHDVPEKPVKLATGDEFDHADYPAEKVACYKCHFNTVQGDGRVPRQVCLGCHNEPDHLARYDDHEFMHKNHVADHKVECFRCHNEIRHGRSPEPELAEATCARCHEGKHELAAKLYRGTGARGVADQPSAMWAASVQCIACHQIPGPAHDQRPGTTYEAGEAACIACHGDDAKGGIAAWKEDLDPALKGAAAALAKAEAAAKGLASAEAREHAASLLDDARHNLDLVRYGNAVHNPDYALAVLEAVGATAQKVFKLLEPTRASAH